MLIYGERIADVYDAMRSQRKYQQAFPSERILEVLKRNDGKQFDQNLVRRFTQLIGIYPVGALVELYTGEVAVVISQNTAVRLMPKVMVVLDLDRLPVKPPRVIERANIKRTLEKGSVPVDTSELFI